ncbi:MAG: hypothetical protein ABIH69_04475 [bacterium]
MSCNKKGALPGNHRPTPPPTPPRTITLEMILCPTSQSRQNERASFLPGARAEVDYVIKKELERLTKKLSPRDSRSKLRPQDNRLIRAIVLFSEGRQKDALAMFDQYEDPKLTIEVWRKFAYLMWNRTGEEEKCFDLLDRRIQAIRLVGPRSVKSLEFTDSRQAVMEIAKGLQEKLSEVVNRELVLPVLDSCASHLTGYEKKYLAALYLLLQNSTRFKDNAREIFLSPDDKGEVYEVKEDMLGPIMFFKIMRKDDYKNALNFLKGALTGDAVGLARFAKGQERIADLFRGLESDMRKLLGRPESAKEISESLLRTPNRITLSNNTPIAKLSESKSGLTPKEIAVVNAVVDLREAIISRNGKREFHPSFKAGATRRFITAFKFGASKAVLTKGTENNFKLILEQPELYAQLLGILFVAAQTEGIAAQFETAQEEVNKKFGLSSEQPRVTILPPKSPEIFPQNPR